MNDSAIKWKRVAYTVGACWLVFAFMCLLGKQLTMWLNPLPILVKGIWGGIIYGYAGSTGGYNLEAIFIYWTLMGLWLSWRFHTSKRKPATIIAQCAVVHVVLFALALFPAMILGGR